MPEFEGRARCQGKQVLCRCHCRVRRAAAGGAQVFLAIVADNLSQFLD
jgi:hypothetical protein